MTILRTLALGIMAIAAPLSVAHAADSNDGRNRNITIYNNSDYQVYRVYYGVPGNEYYARDLLGDEVLNPNYHIRVNVDNGRGNCTYMLKAVTQSNETVWEKTLNVCSESSWTLTN